MLPKTNHLQIHSYKHDKTLHRVWSNVVPLEERPHEMIVANYKTRVYETNGRMWVTKEPAICFFFDDEWFNIIAMIKKDGIYYYCNISSPFLYDDEALKYIDYDLDLRVSPNFEYRILDRNEYRANAKAMKYSKDITDIVDQSLKRLIGKVQRREYPFNHEIIKRYYNEYNKEIIKKR